MLDNISQIIGEVYDLMIDFRYDILRFESSE